MNLLTQEEDHFERLPDVLLLLIFTKVRDAKSLTRCLTVCKRFSSLVPQNDVVFLSLPPKKPTSKTHSRKGISFVLNKFIAKSLNFFYHMVSLSPKEEKNNVVPYYSVNEVLKQFKQVKFLHLELPCYGGDHTCLERNNEGLLLKWKAEFGSELKSCIILGATSFSKTNISTKENLAREKPLREREDVDNNGQVLLSDEELRLRVVWTISCLIAASTRHCLLKKVLEEHKGIERIVVSDVNKQGKILLGKDGIGEMRRSLSKCCDLVEEIRTKVPELRMKMWYLPELELPKSGFLMKGATLIVIRPFGVGEKGLCGEDLDILGSDGMDWEVEAFDEAVREMVRMKKSYALSMSSF